jgi:alpha-glucosidase (family GH31 glycosyl hydrolase)
LRLPFGWNTGDFGPVESREKPDQSELHNAEVEPICKKYLELRYRLLPYNYTLMREAYDTGLPPMRALWLHHADDPEGVRLGDEYLWGRDLLVAPVVHKGEKSRRGTSLDYLHGKCSWTRITWNEAKKTLVIEPDPRNSTPTTRERAFDVLVLPENARHRVTYNGTRVEVGF